ncbi:MAG: hypothetical protein WCI54_01360 [Bacteroidia bacterium]|jgi:hypothetical protein
MKPNSFIKYLLILVLFAEMSCEKTVFDPSFTFGKESAFRLNQIYYSSDGQYSFLINKISDSRCPEGAMCIWQGEITVNGEWIEKKSKTNIVLHSVMSALQKEPDGFTFQIIDAKPHPILGTESKPEDLVLNLLIKGK